MLKSFEIQKVQSPKVQGTSHQGNVLAKRDVHGILLLDKPVGISSNAILQKVKHLYRARKAGHGGSLDPIASGFLPIGFGKATKCLHALLEADKHYQTTMLLGVRTDSGDSEGKILSQCVPLAYSLSRLEEVLERFKGNILQVPPMYSALKYQGQPLYKLARRGIEIERTARPVSIHDLKILNWQGHFLSLEIRASKGTYVRTLVDDIGEALGCGAHVVALRRLGVGNYHADQMVSFEVLENLFTEGGMEKLDACLLS